jgi:hypothetical protein
MMARTIQFLAIFCYVTVTAAYTTGPMTFPPSRMMKRQSCLFGRSSWTMAADDDEVRLREFIAKEADLTSRIKYFGPTKTLARLSTTPNFKPRTIDGTELLERPILQFDEQGMDEALKRVERFDDQIMGGISQSAIIRSQSEVTGGACAVFGGVVRVQGGGFAGNRLKMLKKPLDLSECSGVYLKCRGDGKRYKMNLRDSPTSNEVIYQAEFTPPQDGFATVRIPFQAFRLVKRAVPVKGKTLNTNSIYQFGLVLSKFSFGEGAAHVCLDASRLTQMLRG